MIQGTLFFAVRICFLYSIGVTNFSLAIDQTPSLFRFAYACAAVNSSKLPSYSAPSPVYTTAYPRLAISKDTSLYL
ncbi:hypothetical protein AYI69_g10777 [Smittium culicis]|uniref:Uncharacterized protein n=1 Tax=Smittium culicis TaxID=133412 RepID=A0A1R1X3L0_9FUNG|nr:hypothetical protein AYI69_g10777 [Smittium culicis]